MYYMFHVCRPKSLERFAKAENLRQRYAVTALWKVGTTVMGGFDYLGTQLWWVDRSGELPCEAAGVTPVVHRFSSDPSGYEPIFNTYDVYPDATWVAEPR